MKTHLYRIALLLLTVALQPVAGQAPAPATSPVPTTVAAPPGPPSAQPRNAPIRLNVVVSKYLNDKKLSSLPYALSVSAYSHRASMRMGAQVPYPTAPGAEGKPVPGISYRDVGVRIDATAILHEPGVYQVEVTVEDTSISTSNPVQNAAAVSGVPIFKNFVIANNTVLLKDGQTTQLSSAADPISGETMRVDVTLTVAK